jgi:hypothetical protein
LLVPLDDKEGLLTALDRLMRSDTLRATLGMQARQSVLARFSLPVVLERWDRLFLEARSARSPALPTQHEVRA